MSLIPNHQPPKLSEPSKGALNDVTMRVAPQLAPILMGGPRIVRAGWNDRLNASLCQRLAKFVAVVAFVGNQSFGMLSRSAGAMLLRDGNRIQGGFKQLHLRRRRRVQVCSQRSTRAIDHHHPLCSLPAFGLADLSAPFFAGAKLPSAKHSSQSSLSASFSSANNARHMFRNTPPASHSFKRRQHVLALPYSFGSAAQGDPVQAIHRMPSKHFRSSAAGRPPWGRSGRAGTCFRILAHCSSLTPFQPIRAV